MLVVQSERIGHVLSICPYGIQISARPGVAIAARVAAIAISMRIIGGDKYDLRFYLNSHGFEGTVTANVVAESGKVLASCQFKVEKERGWQEYTSVLTPESTDYKATLQLEFDNAGKGRL